MSDQRLVPNIPCDEGRELGDMLARFCENATKVDSDMGWPANSGAALNTVLVSADCLIKAFREYVLRWRETDERFAEQLRGKDLACWCPLDQPCHADVLLEIANSGGGL
jgi:hypothetical protein